MARSQARILTSIWHDKDFLARSAVAQRLYLLALSQETVSFCGVVAYTAKRWATYASDSTVTAIRKGIDELEANHFVIVDDDTEELWIRSFLKYDGVLTSPNLIRPMVRDYEAVHSKQIQYAIHQYLAEHLPEGLPDGDPKGNGKGFTDPIRDVYAKAFGDPMRDGTRAHSAGPLASCLLPLASKDLSLGFTGTHDGYPQARENRDLDLERPPAKPGPWVDPLIGRIVAVCTGDHRDSVCREAEDVCVWARAHVDSKIIDEAVGFYEQADHKPPVLPRAVATLIRSKAADHGIAIPAFKPTVRAVSA